MKNWISGIVGMICVFLSAPLSATTIFSTFGPGYSFSQSTYTPVNFYTSPEIIGTSLAFAFDVPSHSDYLLSEVRVAASWAGTKKNAHFSIFSDASGLPVELPLLLLAENPASLLPDPSVVSLLLPSALPLVAGHRYWLVVQPASLDSLVPADDYVLLWLNVDATIPETIRVSFDSGPWGDWFKPVISVEAPAFSIEGIPVLEPGTLPLVLAGIFLMLRVKWGSAPTSIHAM